MFNYAVAKYDFYYKNLKSTFDGCTIRFSLKFQRERRSYGSKNKSN